ncbi:MAG TPA: hypothetical protein VK021_09300 [Flavobacteriaceae bacterium]|nr:hypothetical protein [Flavobacteriaceae bacterium]
MINSLFKNLLFSLIILFGIQSQAQETNIMVRVKAKDAKFIGTSIGGAQVQIKDSRTGAVLAEGITQGSTGNTEVIMNQPHQRRENLSDEETAGFLAKLDIEEPTFVTIEAIGPINAKQAEIKSSTQVWVIPERDILGDGIVLEIPGFIVDVLSPQRHQIISKDSAVKIKANVIMTCGCPTTPGGTWNSDDYEVKAIISKEGQKVQEINLTYAGEANTFLGEFKGNSGFYEVIVFSYDEQTGNTGVDKSNFIIR